MAFVWITEVLIAALLLLTLALRVSSRRRRTAGALDAVSSASP